MSWSIGCRRGSANLWNRHRNMCLDNCCTKPSLVPVAVAAQMFEVNFAQALDTFVRTLGCTCCTQCPSSFVFSGQQATTLTASQVPSIRRKASRETAVASWWSTSPAAMCSPSLFVVGVYQLLGVSLQQLYFFGFSSQQESDLQGQAYLAPSQLWHLFSFAALPHW